MTDTDTTTKAPPAWMQREPMAREAVATALDICSRERDAQAAQHRDVDVKQGLRTSALAMRLACDALRGQHPPTETLIATMADYGAARLSCARAATSPTVRSRYMDEAHTFREAVRHLTG
jgi:hypothetical protein